MKRYGALPHTWRRGLMLLQIPLSQLVTIMAILAAALLFSAVQGKAAAPIPNEPDAFTADWLQISTQNAGALLLPPEWSVVSVDEAEERNIMPDVVLHVQQTLYATAQAGAALQIFSIWNSDWDGRVIQASGDITGASGADIAAGMIRSRYGSVKKLSEEPANAALSSALPVITYGVERGNLRYKYSLLFNGEKQIFALLRYPSEYEDYWHSQFATMLNAWASSALTPWPVFRAEAAPAALPAMPVLPESLDPPAQPAAAQPNAPNEALTKWDSQGPKALEQGLGQRPNQFNLNSPSTDSADTFILCAWGALLAFVVLFVCLFKIADRLWQRREDPMAPTSEADAEEVEGKVKAEAEVKDAQPDAVPPLPVLKTRTVADVLNELEALLGSSYIMESMKDDILRNHKDSTHGIAEEGLVMKLCCDSLSAMLQTGRYHICKGILNSDGQELLALFEQINDLRFTKGCSSPEEAAENASFIHSCVRSAGV